MAKTVEQLTEELRQANKRLQLVRDASREFASMDSNKYLSPYIKGARACYDAVWDALQKPEQLS